MRRNIYVRDGDLEAAFGYNDVTKGRQINEQVTVAKKAQAHEHSHDHDHDHDHGQYLGRAVFPTPDHDHGRCAADAIAHAEQICLSKKERLTPIRRRVLEALLASHAPLGAYELIDRLADGGEGRPAPITIYRALDFLREQGLVHRIESRNSFIACVHNHESGDPVVFLICDVCGAVGEATGAGIADAIKAATRVAGFAPKTPVIEISGTCAHCRAA